MIDFNYDDPDERLRFHTEIIGQIWFKVAADIYRQYKSRGRGALTLFMMDEFPPGLEDLLPPGREPTGRGAVGTYIPRDKLLPLENLVGEQGLLQIDKQLGEYDPETTIVFAFISKTKNKDGSTGILSTGYAVKPPEWCSPRSLYDNKPRVDTTMLSIKKDGSNPKINLN